MTLKKSLLIASISFFIGGCATSVSKFSADGNVEELIFPDEHEAWIKDGIYPKIQSVKNIKPNLTKHQVSALIGAPHFSEGFGRVKEWDYILNFHTEGSAQQCQFKVIFDPNMLVKNSYWKPETCSALLEYSPSPLVAEKIQSEKVVEHITERNTYISTFKISSDGFFEFDRFGLQDLQPGGKERLDKLMESIASQGDIVSLNITGHTDRLGTDEYNRTLSQARADTVKSYLVQRGVQAATIQAKGVGSVTPIVECKQTRRDAALINCLAPNRRFEIEVETAKTSVTQQSYPETVVLKQ